VLEQSDCNNSPAFSPTCSSTPKKPQHRNIKDPKKLKVLCINVNGLRGKSLQMEEVIFEQDPDVILCQETKIDSSVSNSELFPSSLTVFRKDRTRDGGGVCIAVKSHLNAVECHDLEDSETETIWIQLQGTDHQPVYICSFYRPPGKKTDYLERLRTPLETLSTRHRGRPPHIFLAGDFNYPLIDWLHNSAPSESEGGILVSILDDFHLQQIVSAPTRFSPTTSSLLDLVITSHPALITGCSVGREFSDHCILSFYISKHVCSLDSPPRKIYLYNKGNYDNIRYDMRKFNTTFFQSSPENISVNENWLRFKAALHTSITRNVPSKTVYSRTRRPPWLTTSVRRLIKKRNNLSKVALRSGSHIDRDRYRKVRNQTSKEIDSAYQNHLNHIIGNLTTDPRGFYRFIKSRRTDTNGIPTLKTANGIASSDVDKARSLNDYFISVFTDEDQDTIPTILPSIYPDMPAFEVTTPGVYKLLSGLDTRKSLGPDEISPRVMKETCSEISGILTFIFNQSLNSGVVPADWRIANIFALHKKNSKDLPENYRPISLTSISSKILEHIVYSSISRFLSDNSILTPRQHGFRSGFSCETQLVLTINDWAKSIDHSLSTDVAIFDFSKAFDSVPHERLLVKLQSYGIRGNILTWLSSFLTNRDQRVMVNGSQSSWLPVTSGVPQGTVLGPLLFLLYINDITDNIDSEIRLFADDCILYRTIRSSADQAILQHDIDTLHSWSSVWQMNFNSQKSHIMSITRQRSKLTRLYRLGTDILSQVDSYPYLGVTISSDLRWHDHINRITSKATRTLNFVRRNVYNCSSEAKSLAYTSLVRPQLEYAAAAWDPYRIGDIQAIEKVQRRAARFVFRDYRHTTSVTNLLDRLHWPSLSSRRTISRLTLFYKAAHNLPGIPLQHLQRPSRSTRTADDTTFISLSARTDPYRHSFFPRTVNDWNQLTREQRTKPSADAFRQSLLPHYQ